MIQHSSLSADPETLPFWLTEGLARRLGLRLSTVLGQGVLSRTELSQMVERCCGCESMALCIDFLSERPGVEPAPLSCANVRLLGRLADRR